MNERWDWVERWASYRPEKVALKDGATGEVFTYGALNQLANHLAHIITGEWKLTAGDRIGLLAENNLTFVVLFVAAQKTGVILIPMNWRLSPHEIDYLIQDSQPKVCVVQARFHERLKQDAPHYQKVEHLVEWEQLTEDLKTSDAVVYQPTYNLKEDDPIFILYTSGTTGFPKGALYTHRMLFWNSVNTALRLDLTSQDVTLNVMPLFHTGGWNVLLTPFLHRGATTLMLPSFEPDRVLKTLEQEGVTIFMGVPTMLKMIADHPSFDQTDLEKLRYMIVGGEPMPIPLIEVWEKKGIPIRQGYGMTEAGPNLTSLHHSDAIRKKGSIGKPNFYVHTRILDESGVEAQANETGELLIKGPMVTPGYWRNSEATKRALEDGWLHTGDLVRQDEEGYLYVVDRIKNMFISGGENVYPAEVERILGQMEGIKEVAVIPTPHEKWGEVGKAFIVLEQGITFSESATLAHCRTYLAKFKVPQSFVCLEELPKNGTGKIDRVALKKEAYSSASSS
ncbi:MAG: long-chain fatty acid--CoA ligase [Bacteroidota bacterium]